MHNYPKRLIEVDLPIKRISAHARREKNIRNGHFSTLHIWWARRPLAACRAVILASLWPDPADPACPVEFLNAARQAMQEWTTYERQILLSPESRRRFDGARKNPALFDELEELRGALLDFIADFSNWDNSTDSTYLATSRLLTQIAHESLGGVPGTRPLVLDPFAGGGSLPLEALRVGADAFASDLNPIPVLLNKVVLEYIPKFGQRLADEANKWGAWLKQEAIKECAEFYPADPDGATPIAYLWARTIQCEGPGCGAVIPLMNQTLISRRRGVGVKLIVKNRSITVDVRTALPVAEFGPGTVRNGKVTCPVCQFTMAADRYRARAKEKHLGELHFCTVLSNPDGTRKYRNPSGQDNSGFLLAQERLRSNSGQTIPNERLSSTEPRRLNVLYYGFEEWGDLFNPRQRAALSIFSKLLARLYGKVQRETGNSSLAEAVTAVSALSISNIVQYNCSMSTWLSDGMISVFIQSSSIPMRADYAEANPLMEKLVGGLQFQLDRTTEAIEALVGKFDATGNAVHSSATKSVLPEDSVDLLATDPPYYFAIPYAELSDFFYVWLKRFLNSSHGFLFSSETTPKADEAIQNLPHSQAEGQKDRAHFEAKIYESLLVGRMEVKPTGLAVVVFAHASTEGWESLLKSLLAAGWVITGSWPIDTEREGRMLASRQRSLASSVHLVCRPRENSDGSLRTADIGDWRDVLAELPRRIHEWMPRLAEEGVVGADAIFACLGPALEIFSRYSRVEKASGEEVTLREYLEHVWAAVAKEALAQVFKDADTAGFEPDARLTAMWLWTLNAGASGSEESSSEEDQADSDDEDDAKSKGKAKGGFVLEFDAARKIAQGLGASLEDLSALVEVSGDSARLLPVSERTRHLFGKDQKDAPAAGRKKKTAPQMDLFAELTKVGADETAWQEKTVQKVGETTLDRIHQSMILFATGRGEALKRFLVDDGAGKDQRFWRLAQALSALYPASTNEKRWVDGVLARKKGLGL
ncbi:MAG TPA: DUF1156 domain-containing protein [Nitrospira sp.]|jgi:putative DNA methylase|nr:DUF1156 domain-containing protein [Nitrospira sp.]